MSCVGAEEVCLVFLSLFIKSCDGSIKFFKESDRFGKVNVKPLTDIPIFVEYLSGKGQLTSLLFTVYVVLRFGV